MDSLGRFVQFLPGPSGLFRGHARRGPPVEPPVRRGAQLLAMLMVIGGATAAGAAPLEDPPRPLALYPERPGAKFEDIEAEPGHVVRRAGLGIASSSIRATYGLSLERWGRDRAGAAARGLASRDRGRTRAGRRRRLRAPSRE